MAAITLSLFPNKTYGILVCCNSADYQKATVTLENGDVLSFSKTRPGVEPNQMISQAGQTFTTGSKGSIQVDIQNSSNNTQWRDSMMIPTSLGFGGGQTPWMWLVTSEDGSDDDYNDCVVIAYTLVS
jgi:hypothetical protein